MPLRPVPESVREAIERTNVDVPFSVSSTGIGPVTFGFFRPVVLLPESFLALDRAAQCAIACHELIHVRRRDWLMTVVEEIVSGLFWFHPALWWLMGQARLAREQLVDAEVIRITAARGPYINALLTMAGGRSALDLAPAPLFLRRRHLLQRMHLLVTEVSMSKFRLYSSYVGIVGILAMAAWVGVAAFPLTGRAEIKMIAAPVQQNQPGYVVNIQPLSYPQEAIQKRIEGTVVVELAFNATGNIVDSRVLSGPEELRRAALESALRGPYSINVARTLQVVVEFHLPAGGQAKTTLPFPPPPPPAPPPPPPPGAPVLHQGTILDSIRIQGLSELEASDLQRRLGLVQGQPVPSDISYNTIKDAATAIGISRPVNELSVVGTSDNRVLFTLGFGREPLFGQRGGVRTPFGVVGGVGPQTPFGDATLTPTIAIEPISKVDVVYPRLAQEARIQGVVVLEVKINTEGKVENLRVMAGHPLLIQAAIDAAKQWVYPAQADPVTTTATINFSLSQ
jgi:TonB family protein